MNAVKKFLKSVADNRNTIIKNTFIIAAGVSGSVFLTALLAKDEPEVVVEESGE